MNEKVSSKNQVMAFDWMQEAYEYWLDSSQRWILFMDVLRRRGNNYFDTIKKGEPPVLVFDYEVILEGRTLDRPVNYDLAKILPGKTDTIDPRKRPIVVIDPRAGNGPGIGGSKQDSEIGDALAQGHPVYFILFHPEPIQGQTLEDVEKAEVCFIEEVALLHPKAEKPAVIGNCQAGWAVALLGADRPDLTGPLVLNGTPLSYWSGVQGKNPMRYMGGLLGGIWMVSLLSDLGNGKFDGAWLEENFENLNPGNTLWSKQYSLYANIDSEAERYLTFEK
jgi:pimeloyl-ACP methyl ester carboxylesterase